MSSEPSYSKLLYYIIVFLIGLQLLFESSKYEKDFEEIKQILIISSNSKICAQLLGLVLVFSSLFTLLFRLRSFEKLLFIILFCSVATVYNPTIKGFTSKSLINVSLIAVMLMQKKPKRKEKIQ